MADNQPGASTGRVPDAFTEALALYRAGQLGLPALVTVLRSSLGQDLEAALAVQFLLDDAKGRGQLDAEAWDGLMPVVDAVITEDIPTHWSAESEDAGTRPAPGSPPPVILSGPLVEPGTVLKDRFELEALVGGGAMGQVFRARDRRRAETGAGEAQVALKVVSARMPAATRALEALRQEAAVTQRLSHPAVVRVNDLDRHGDLSFLVMEWLQGESLARLLDRRRGRPMPRLQALQIVEAIARALAHAHGLGIVHGDVKPGNVFITEDSGPRLLDFGVARAAENPGGPERIRGLTPEYASCEVLEGQDGDPRDDLYSLACVAYRMLAGRRPFGRQTALEAETAGRRPVPIESLTAAQWRALDRALAFRREQRQDDVVGFLAQLKGPREDLASRELHRSDPDTVLTVPNEDEPPSPDPGPGDLPERGNTRLPAIQRPWRLVAAAAALGGAALWALLPGTPRDPPTLGDEAMAVSNLAGSSAGTIGRQDAPPDGAPPANSGVTSALTPPPAMAAVVPTPAPLPAAPPQGPPAPTAAAGPPEPPGASGTPVPEPGTEPAVLAAASPTAVLAADRSGRLPAGASGTPGSDSPAAASLRPPPDGGASVPGGAGTGPDAAPAGLDPGAGPGAGQGSSAPAGEATLASLGMKKYVAPEYPRRAAFRKQPGWVDVGFAVDDRGRPQDLRVLGAEPAGVFEEAALEAVGRWRFSEPADLDLAPGIRSRVRVRFQAE